MVNTHKEDTNTEKMEEDKQPKSIMGIFTREQFIMLCVAVGLAILLIVIVVPAVVVTQTQSGSGSSGIKVPFSSDGDMLEFLMENGKIPDTDGLYATWYHSANNKSQLNDALKSSVMVLEADVNVEGHGTANQTNIPIMAHPPAVYSDNTLQEWIDVVLKSDKGIKLDFKSIEAVEPTLDILRVKNQTARINRPVWLNADIIHGPGVPSFIPVVNGTRFLQLIQQKFPEVTISPGWKVLYVPQFPNVTYTLPMMEKMYNAVLNVPQKITFPILAVMAKQGWPHISWLLSQSPRFSLTLWQGAQNPTLNDLLFIRDNSSPQRIYYDIYEPVLSQFKEAAKLKGRPRRFYPGGDLVDYFKPKNNDGSNIQWQTVTSREFLLSVLRGSSSGMLVIPVVSSAGQPKKPAVESSGPELSLQECLELIYASPKPWGIYLRVKSPSQLAPSLQLLSTAYDQDLLYHPTWVNMEVSHGAFQTPGYISAQDFLSTVEGNFPFVTLAPAWPREALGEGYTRALVENMLQLLRGVYQDVSLQLSTEPLGKSDAGLQLLQETQKRFSLTVEIERATDPSTCVQLIRSLRQGGREQIFFNMPQDYMSEPLNEVNNF
ncbi:protein FAM151A isoform X1 [Alosa sapidissima]|uniref:protein FAM151A isoform X1 n=1 Tax=Alosa sapidissima TaxID=34773 RepID=UPI001C084B68|nr:protein FAM151A isoform X1 [Alosa sapidissima]